MTNAQSTLRSSGSQQDGSLTNQRLKQILHSAPIPFIAPKKSKSSKKSAKDDSDSDSEEESKTKTRSFEVDVDPNNEDAGKYTFKIATFDSGTPEEYCEWRTEVDILLKAKGWNTNVESKLSMFRALLVKRAGKVFNQAHTKRTAENAAARPGLKVPQSVILLRALNDLGSKFFPKPEQAEREQKRYL